MRERLADIAGSQVCFRITPARAGKTEMHLHWIQDEGDHPRSCGKDFKLKPLMLRLPGSPPLVRERQYGFSENIKEDRITPARAGKTPTSLTIKLYK